MENEVNKYNLSYGQQSLYFLQELNPSSTAYNVGIAFEFFQRFDEQLFRLVFDKLMLKHEILKTKFFKENGEIYQYIDEGAEYDFVIEDIRDLDSVEISNKINSDFHKSYDLLVDSLLRVYLYPKESYVIVSIVLHHVIADFNSVEIFMNDFITIYDALANGHDTVVRRIETPYKSFVNGERQFISSNRFPEKMAFWENKLKVTDTRLDFGVEKKQPQEFLGSRGAKVEFEINSEENKKIEQLCLSIHVSPFIFFLTVYHLLLCQVYGRRDTIVGVPVSLRRALKYREAIGNFVNLLPIKMESKNGNFVEMLKTVNSTFVEAMLHKRVPYPLMVEKINPNRDKKDPIFQTTFNYLSKRTDSDLYIDQSLDAKQTIIGYSIKGFPVKQQLDQMDLALELVENREGFTGIFKYNIGIFKQSKIDDYISRYKKLISRVVNHIEIDLQKLRYADDNERRELMTASKRRSKIFKEYSNVVKLIEENTAKYPEKIAVRDMYKTLTYGQMQTCIDSLAYQLRQRGIKKGEPVIVYMDKRAEVIVAFLSIMKIGAVYVPVDISFPKNRINYILEQTASTAIITREVLKEQEEFLREAITVEEALEVPLHYLATNAESISVESEDSAYIIFTSGSTGKPKGVEVQHRALINFLQSMSELLNLRKKEKVNIGGITPISIDITIFEFLLPLTLGGETSLLTKDIITTPHLFTKVLEEFGINIFQGTSTTWTMILGSEWQGKKELDVLVGGEMVSKSLSNQLLSNFSKVWNVYGPTEATIWATIKQLSVTDELISAGSPIHNMEAYVLDEFYEIAPKNITGKLYLSGVGLAVGYFKQEILTQERFFDIEIDGCQKRIYDTGDLAKYLDNGEIQIVGRTDDQIKLSGYRIELGEIENILSDFPGIKGNTVLLKGDKLVAYIVHEEERNNLSEEIRSFCSQNLPPYMMPSEFIRINQIPLTPNQKVDKKKLLSLEGEVLSKTRGKLADSPSSYQKVSQIWGDILGHWDFDAEDNFFDIGGTSLLAMSLQQRLEEELQVKVGLSEIFTYPTISGLSNFLKLQTCEEGTEMPSHSGKQRRKNRLGDIRERRNRKPSNIN